MNIFPSIDNSRLIDLGRNPKPSFQDFLNGHADFLHASHEEREEYARTRLELIARVGGDPGLCDYVHSSTGTTGTKKQHKLGPSTFEIMRFWRVLTLEGLEYDSVVDVSVHGGHVLAIGQDAGRLDHVRMRINPPAIEAGYSVSVYLPLAKNSGLDAIIGNSSKAVIQVSPYVLRELNANGLPWKKYQDRIACVSNTRGPLDHEAIEPLLKAGIHVRDNMRVYDGGASFYTCKYGSCHWCGILARTRIQDGWLVSDDLMNLCSPTINYRCGDQIEQEDVGVCRCGLRSVSLSFKSRSWKSFMIGQREVPYAYAWTQTALAADEAGCPIKLTGLCVGIGSMEIALVVDDAEGVMQDRTRRNAMAKIVHAKLGLDDQWTTYIGDGRVHRNGKIMTVFDLDPSIVEKIKKDNQP